MERKEKNTNYRSALVLCNGLVPALKFFLPYLKKKPFIVCADGGANKARTIHLVPNVIIGDLDSITMQTRRAFKTVPIIHMASQYSTDLEKALEYLLQQNITTVEVFGATGNRSDHTMSNFSILQKYHKKMRIQFIDEFSSIEIVDSNTKFNAVVGQQISLMPMGICKGITTRGLKYPLKNESLALGIREGSSNEAISSVVSISIKKGNLLLFKNHFFV